MTVSGLVRTGHVTVAVEIPSGFSLAGGSSITRALPGGWQPLGPPAGAATTAAAIKVTEGPGRVCARGTAIHVEVPGKSLCDRSWAYAVYTAAERHRQQSGMATVHASAVVAADGRAVLLLGDKAAGKTTTCLALARGHGFTHAGDDIVIIRECADGHVVLPGKPTAALRVRSRHFYAPKQIVSLDTDGFLVGDARVGLTVRIAVHPDAVPKTVPAVPLSLNERLRLHENLARYISGLPTPVSGATDIPYGPVWPLDTRACTATRRRMIEQLSNSPFAYVYAPTATEAAALIVEAMNT